MLTQSNFKIKSLKINNDNVDLIKNKTEHILVIFGSIFEENQKKLIIT